MKYLPHDTFAMVLDEASLAKVMAADGVVAAYELPSEMKIDPTLLDKINTMARCDVVCANTFKMARVSVVVGILARERLKHARNIPVIPFSHCLRSSHSTAPPRQMLRQTTLCRSWALAAVERTVLFNCDLLRFEDSAYLHLRVANATAT